MQAPKNTPGWLLFFGLLWNIALATPQATAQTVLSGTVRSAAGEPLGGVLLEAETKTQPPVTAFVISAADGSFVLKLAVPSATDSVYLHARALGYVAQRLGLANRSQTVPLTLAASPTQLREVTVKAAPITRHRDTLDYNVSSFTGKQDRVIADVLKKMPGIEVDGDGRISYQGNPINKFYINGQDLLEGRYNLASNNLPAEAVQSVQVLERHQPIRALDSLNRPDNAALNLQLKRKVTATGQVQLGAGWGPAPLGALWSANLSPMLFTGRQQLLDTYQTNNTGQDVAGQLRSLTPADLPRANEPTGQRPDLTHVVGLGRAPVAASRYLFNRVQLLSANHLVPLGPENQLRVNASYLHDVQTARGGTQTRFFLPDNRTVTLTEAKVSRATLNNLLADLAFSKNVKRYYLKNTLSLDGRWDAQTGTVYRPETNLHLAQAARTPFLTVANRLGLVRPLRGGPLLQLSSLLRFSNSPQQLTVTPGPFAPLLTGGVAYDSARQQVGLASFFTDNSAGLTLVRGNWAYSGLAGFSQEIQRLTSALTTTAESVPAGLPLRNDLHWYRGRYYLEPGLSGKSGKWEVRLRAPLSYYALRAADAPLGSGQRQRAVVAEPSLSLTRPLGRHWQVSADAGRSTSFGDISQLNYAYLLRDYRTLQRNNAPLARTQTQHYGGSLYFQDPLRSRFLYASYNFSCALSNRLYSSQVDASGALTSVALDQKNRATSHLLNANLSQFISPWKTNLSLGLLGNLRRQPQVLNSQLTETRTRSATASLKASISAFEWGSMEGSASLTTLRSQLAAGAAATPALVQEHRASASLFPVGGHQLTLSADYYDSRGPAPAVRAVFADLLYRYALPTKGRKIDLELRWSNIFDTRQYQYSFVSPFQLAQTTYQLRPAQVLASARMSL